MNTLIDLFVAIVVGGYRVAILLTLLGALIESVHRAAIRRVWI